MATRKNSKIKALFSYHAPNAQSVQVAADFTEWQRAPLSLKKQRDGLWKGSVSLAPGTYEYRLLVDGEWTDDPQCMNRRPNEFGSQNCICVVEAPQAPKEAAGAEPAVQNA